MAHATDVDEAKLECQAAAARAAGCFHGASPDA